jgi:hypothetical protein
MRARLMPLPVVVAVACSGCASAGALRAHAERGAPIVTRVVAAPLEPATGFLLVNPLVCSSGGGGGGGAVLVVIGCMCVLGAVDLVAMPVQAVRRHGQWRDLERIGSACPVEDPSSRLTGDLASKMVQDFRFSPPPDPAATPPGAVTLEVRTASFTRSSRIAWEGTIVFRASDDAVLWQDACEAEAPARDAETFERECEAARAEVAALADQCVESVARRRREAWRRVPAIPATDSSSESRR